MKTGRLHRNFMGYTTSKTKLMIGLGASSISDSWYGFAQNVKNLEEYSHLTTNGILPIYRGHLLTVEDRVIRRHILNLMCNFQTSWEDNSLYVEELPVIIGKLQEMESDGLLEMTDTSIIVTEKGRPFIRNICMAFDLLLHRKAPGTQVFSMTV
jgi:oxygen-independent coproporphyrinogen-3 oxidase